MPFAYCTRWKVSPCVPPPEKLRSFEPSVVTSTSAPDVGVRRTPIHVRGRITAAVRFASGVAAPGWLAAANGVPVAFCQLPSMNVMTRSPAR